jgi:hypothetical protein
MKHYSLDNQIIVEPSRLFTGIVECEDGTRYWYVDNIRHRIDGPAYIGPDGYEEYWVNCKQVTELEHDLLYNMLKLKGLI